MTREEHAMRIRVTFTVEIEVPATSDSAAVARLVELLALRALDTTGLDPISCGAVSSRVPALFQERTPGSSVEEPNTSRLG